MEFGDVVGRMRGSHMVLITLSAMKLGWYGTDVYEENPVKMRRGTVRIQRSLRSRRRHFKERS